MGDLYMPMRSVGDEASKIHVIQKEKKKKKKKKIIDLILGKGGNHGRESAFSISNFTWKILEG